MNVAVLAAEVLPDVVTWADSIAQLSVAAILALLIILTVRALAKRQIVTGQHHGDVVKLKDDLITDLRAQVSLWQSIANRSLQVGQTAVDVVAKVK